MTDDHVSARVQIQYTMAVYCNSVDAGDIVGVVSAFTPNARLELSNGVPIHGQAAIQALYEPIIGAARPDREPGGAIPLVRHNLTTSRVEFVSDNSAEGSTYFITLTRHGPDHAGRYVDRFVRHGDRWLIEDRRIVVEWYASPSWYEGVRLKAYAAKA